MRVPFHRPEIGREEIDEVTDSLLSGWLTTGPKTKLFEEEFSRAVGASHAVALNSCTAALHLALEAVGLKEGEAVITSPMTFAATAGVVRYFGARTVFVDVERDTLNMDPALLEKALKELDVPVRAVLPIHYAGHPCEMDAITDACGKSGIKVVEDAAHAFPSAYKGRPVGSLGDITCFSFYATKTLTTGEGGMAVTEDEALADRMRVMSLHGISKDAWKRYGIEGDWYYEVVAPGFKYNMPDIAAALGLVQLRKAEAMQRRREAIAARYDEAFGKTDWIEVPAVRKGMRHSRHLYVIRLNLDTLTIDRNAFIDRLREKGIGTSVHFIPLHTQPYYRDLYGFAEEDFPVSFGEYRRIISLPIFPGMEDKEIDAVVSSVLETAENNSR